MRSRIETLEPDFQPLVKALLVSVEQETGRRWGISDARRTMAEQKVIYAQGRTAPGKVVSNAPPGRSAHNFGYAVDIWPLTKGGNDFDWAAPDSIFRKMAQIAKRMGLTPGYFFKTIHDAPHVEMAKWKERQALWLAGKLQLA